MARYNRCDYCGGILRHFAVEDPDPEHPEKPRRHIYMCHQSLGTLDGVSCCGRGYARDDSQLTVSEVWYTSIHGGQWMMFPGPWDVASPPEDGNVIVAG